MNNEDYEAMSAGLVAAGRAFPNCPVASCDCDQKNKDEWKKGCHCLGHFFQMDTVLGKDKWNLTDFGESVKAGKPVKAKKKKEKKP